MISVLIVDDHEVLRQSLSFLLSQEPDIDVVGECADGQSAIRAVAARLPDVVLLDLFLPDQEGIAVLSRIKRDRPATEVVMLTSSTADEHLLDAIRNGAIAYVPKTGGAHQLVATIRAAAAGESLLDPAVAGRLIREVRRPAGGPGPLDQLSPRELEVLAHLARGRSNREIARALTVTEDTAKAHVSNILAKLHLNDRTQAAIFALQQRLVPLDQALDKE